jgi:hypothetical protein
MSLPKIIGIYSPVRQSGKSTAAGVLSDGFGYKTFKYAAPLYAMWQALCDDAMLPHDVYVRSLSDLKEAPLAQVGMSFRQFAETIGTKWGRNMISPTLWVDIARVKMQTMLANDQKIVVDDMRFGNEFDLVKSLGGSCIKVIRPIWNGGIELNAPLPSEGHLAAHPFDMVFANDRDAESLKEKVRDWLTSHIDWMC